MSDIRTIELDEEEDDFVLEQPYQAVRYTSVASVTTKEFRPVFIETDEVDTLAHRRGELGKGKNG